MRFGIGPTIAKAATTMRTFGIQFIKDNLKLFFDFKNTDLEHVGTGSASFDGTDDYIEYTDATLLDSLEGITQLTIVGWARRDAQGGTLLSKGAYNTVDTDWAFQWYHGSNARINFSLGNDVTAWASPPDQLLDASGNYTGEWVHYALTYDSTAADNASAILTYHNGVLFTDGTTSGTLQAIESNGQNIRIGCNSAGGNDLNGRLKNVAAWSRVLSASEIQNIMYKSYADLKGSELTHLQFWADLDSDLNAKNNAGATITGNASNQAAIVSSLYGNNVPRKPRGVDNSRATLADQIGSGSAYFVTTGESTEDYIDCGDGAHTGEGKDTLTFTSWIKHDPDISDSFGRIAGKGHDDSWQIMIDESGVAMSIAIYINGNLIQTSSNEITANIWHHVAFTYDKDAGSGTCLIYIDGVLVHSDTSAGGGNTIGTNDHSLVIGADESTTTQGWGGYIAQVGLWERVLTQEEIQEISQKQYSELTTTEKGSILCYYGLGKSLTGYNLSITLDNNNTATTTKSLENTSITHSTTTSTKITSDTLTEGKVYKIVLTKTNVNTSGYCNLSHQQIGAGATTIKEITSLSGTFTFFYRALVSGRHLTIQSGGGTTQWSGTIDNISVEEYNGNPGELL